MNFAELAAQAAEQRNTGGGFPLLLVCEHAGAAVPAPWQGLGLDPACFTTHYAYDPGTADLTRALSDGLDAPAVLAHWSRIFLDYNRFADQWDYMRPDLGGIPVPGNLAITPADRALRQQIAAAPLAAAIDGLLPGRAGMVAIHSFTPVMNGVLRDVDLGFLWREDSALVRVAWDEIQRQGRAAGLRVGDNAPYDWRQATAHTLQHHGLARGLPCFCLELRNDLFSEGETSGNIAGLLVRVLQAIADRRAEWAPDPQRGCPPVRHLP